jgi:hypothetical protein
VRLEKWVAHPHQQGVEALVRPASADKPEVQRLVERGVKIRVVDIAGPTEELVKSLAGIDVLISAIDAMGQLAQLSLASAAKEAGVKRFVPCAFTTVAPPGGVMGLRDSVRAKPPCHRISHFSSTLLERTSIPTHPQAVPPVYDH